MTEVFLALLTGVLAITLIDVFGSITSRRWNYHYGYLTPLSFAVYTMIGYSVSLFANMNIALSVACIVGIYDGTIGWKIALALRANMGNIEVRSQGLNVSSRIIYMILVGTVFGYLGYLISTNGPSVP